MRLIIYITIIIIFIFNIGCISTQISGIYVTDIPLDYNHNTFIRINKDGSFNCKKRYITEFSGSWIKKDGFLYLFSDSFKSENHQKYQFGIINDSILYAQSPHGNIYKNTDVIGKDVYVIKGYRIYPTDGNGNIIKLPLLKRNNIKWDNIKFEP